MSKGKGIDFVGRLLEASPDVTPPPHEVRLIEDLVHARIEAAFSSSAAMAHYYQLKAEMLGERFRELCLPGQKAGC
jgi:hypothetical protein